MDASGSLTPDKKNGKLEEVPNTHSPQLVGGVGEVGGVGGGDGGGGGWERGWERCGGGRGWRVGVGGG